MQQNREGVLWYGWSFGCDLLIASVIREVRMRWFVIGAVVGACVAALALTISTDLPRAPARAELIAKWRQIQPGMTRDDAIRALGAPTYDFEPGCYLEWAQVGFPDAFRKDHGLLVFTIERMGPQLLLVYIDSNRKVAFVSSTST